ncbi:hypothetical protein ACHAWT_009105 [Skeletonema menzelii]
MKISLVILAAVLGTTEVVLARSSGRPSSSAARRSSGGGSRSSGRSSSRSSGSRRRREVAEEEENDPLDFGLDDDVNEGADEYDEYDEEEYDSAPRRSSKSRGPPPRAAASRRRGPPPASRFDDYDEDEYDDYQPRRRGGSSSRGPPQRRGPPPGRNGQVVSYNRGGRRGPPQPSTFTRGLSAIRDRMPDPNTVKDTVLSATKAAQAKTTSLSSNLYREVKGLTSSELEQVMLKSTRPDDTPVKSKHVERLVGVTYQISGKYDIYDAVLRKLWNKMAEKDLRTKMKSVYVLHRFSVDGGPEHQEALKQRLRALRKTKDPKRAGSRYFDSKVLMGVDPSPENQGFRAFLSRYAHYVLTRAQTFGGVFNEISLANMPPAPSSKKSRSKSSRGGGASAKPKNPPLCEEHLKFAQMVLKAGLACTLNDGEEQENTAMCVERVAADLMGLTAAVAVALKRELKEPNNIDADSEALVKQWCEFYSQELLPDTKKFVKKTSSKLDAYGLYLPSRISTSLPQELLDRGLKLGGEGADNVEEDDEENEEEKKPDKSEEKCDDASEERSDAEEAEERDASIAMSATSQADDDQYDYDYDYDDEYDD